MTSAPTPLVFPRLAAPAQETCPAIGLDRRSKESDPVQELDLLGLAKELGGALIDTNQLWHPALRSTLRAPLSAAPIQSKFNNQNCIFRKQTDKHNQAYLYINIAIDTRNPGKNISSA